MIKVGVAGAGGYAGVTLLQILLRHPEVKITWLISEPAHKGKRIAGLYPHLLGEMDLSIQTLEELPGLLSQADLVFLALPHGIAMDYVPRLLEAGKKVIDLGADFRFNDGAVFTKWYQVPHRAPNYLAEAVFGLPELYRQEVKKARLISNPGCYPTSAILALSPLLKEKLIDLETIIVDSKSGTSGAGRGASLKTHFCERDEGVEAYAVASHRHMGEIEYQLSRVAGFPDLKVTFVPHLMPMERGILSTVYAKLLKKTKAEELVGIYQKFYQGEPFVRVRKEDLPNTKFVAGTNYCDLGLAVNEATGKVIVLSAIDNLVKGAAGQAVQNMNLACGFAETTALSQIALYP